MGFSQYENSFREHEINGEALLELGSLEEFKHMNIFKLGHIKIIQKYINLIKET